MRFQFKNSLFTIIASSLLVVGCSQEKNNTTEPEKLSEPSSAIPLTISRADVANADLIIMGGPIYTATDERPVVEAVAIQKGTILAAGTTTTINAHKSDSTQIIDLKGAALYPGFTDSHAHFLDIGLRALTLNLEGTASISALVEAVEAAVGDAKPGDVIYGSGWIETGWPENRFPNKNDLDAVSPDNPVLLSRADGHAVVVNSAAIKAAGLTKDTKSPDGGRIEKDENGELTGMFVDAAMALVSSLVEEPTTEQKREAFAKASEIYASRGWTGMHNMSVDVHDVLPLENLASGPAKDATVKIRLYNSLNDSGLKSLAGGGARMSANKRIITRAIKLYVDGALGSRGAALEEPYADDAGNKGLVVMTPEDAKEKMLTALRSGIQVNTHAIGDRGNRLALDWIEDVFAQAPGDRNWRWRIEHAQIINPADFERMKKLNIIASMQPSHAISDMHFAPARLGDERLDGAYAWRSLLDAGVNLTGGSDAPVEIGNPLIEFYAAVARRDLKGFQGDDWRANERLTREEALKLFTVWPAYASFQEKSIGTIETGKKADFTAFSADIMKIAEEDIPEAHAVLTVVDGDVIFAADHLADLITPQTGPQPE